MHHFYLPQNYACYLAKRLFIIHNSDKHFISKTLQ